MGPVDCGNRVVLLLRALDGPSMYASSTLCQHHVKK